MEIPVEEIEVSAREIFTSRIGALVAYRCYFSQPLSVVRCCSGCCCLLSPMVIAAASFSLVNNG